MTHDLYCVTHYESHGRNFHCRHIMNAERIPRSALNDNRILNKNQLMYHWICWKPRPLWTLLVPPEVLRVRNQTGLENQK